MRAHTVPKISFLVCIVAALIYGGTTARAQMVGDTAYECNLSGASSGNLVGCPVTYGPGTNTVYTTITGNSDSNNITCQSSGLSGNYCGARAGGTAVTPIYAWGNCEWVDNSSSNALFVPFRTAAEWSDFLAAASGIGGVAITPCILPLSQHSDPANVTVTPPYAGCNSTTVHSPSVYGRYNNSTWPVPENTSATTPSFTCHSGATTIQSLLQYKGGNPAASGSAKYTWTTDFHFSPDVSLTATSSVDASNTGTAIIINVGDSATLAWSTSGAESGQTWSCTASGSWDGVKVPTTSTATSGSEIITPDGSGSYILACSDNYGLTSTASVTVNVNGVCGSDAGTTVNSAPVNLCAGLDYSSGLALYGSTWSWMCNPDGGGIPQSCSANMCVPSWVTNSTSECSASCGPGLQTLSQSDGCGHTQTVSQACNNGSCCTPSWTVTGISECSATCGGGVQTVYLSDGCGGTSEYSQACNTDACAPSCSPSGSFCSYGSQCCSGACVRWRGMGWNTYCM